MTFFGIIVGALEDKSGTTWAVLKATAFGRAHAPDDTDSEADANAPLKKGQVGRFSKRTLLWYGNEESVRQMLIWACVGPVVMHAHYHFFKHTTFYSHVKTARCTIFDLCGEDDAKNIAAMVLTDLARLLFDPDGVGAQLAAPLLNYLRVPSSFWPPDVLHSYQHSCLIAFTKLWRSLWYAWQVYPWKLVPAYNRELPMATRRACGEALFATAAGQPCGLDPYLTKPLVSSLCADVDGLFEEQLEDFLHALISRCVPTSTFVERIFAPLTRATRKPQTVENVYTLVGGHLRGAWMAQVHRWTELLDQPSTAQSSSLRRTPSAHTSSKGIKTCGWQMYVKAHPPPPETPDKERAAHNRAKQREWTTLPQDAQEPHRQEAARARAAARARPSPLEEDLRSLEAAEVPAGPWGLASMSGGMAGKFPLGTHEVTKVLEGRGSGAVRAISEAFCTKHDRVVRGADDWPEGATFADPCHPGECTHVLSEPQRARFKEVSDGIRLALRHSGTPAGVPVCLQFLSGPNAVYACFFAVARTDALQCVAARMVEVPEGANRAFGPVDLEFMKADAHLGVPWPQVASEKGFVMLLLELSLGPWDMVSITTQACGSASRHELDRKPLPLEWLREAELRRLEELHALRLLAKMSAKPMPKTTKTTGGKGLGRGRGGARGRGRGRGGGGGDSSGELGSSAEDSPPCFLFSKMFKGPRTPPLACGFLKN